MGEVLATARLAYRTGSDEDVSQNNWHFETPVSASLADAADALVVLLKDNFYQPLAAYYSSVLGTAHELRVYDWLKPEPRVPEIRPFSVTFGGAPLGNLPEELAVVLTIHTGEPYTKRTRGRLYLGPLGTECLDAVDLQPARVSAAAQQAFCDRALTVLQNGIGYSWEVWSTVNGFGRHVQGGYVDNAFDVQRRRGVDPTQRREFGAATPSLLALNATRMEDGLFAI